MLEQRRCSENLRVVVGAGVVATSSNQTRSKHTLSVSIIDMLVTPDPQYILQLAPAKRRDLVH